MHAKNQAWQTFSFFKSHRYWNGLLRKIKTLTTSFEKGVIYQIEFNYSKQPEYLYLALYTSNDFRLAISNIINKDFVFWRGVSGSIEIDYYKSNCHDRQILSYAVSKAILEYFQKNIVTEEKLLIFTCQLIIAFLKAAYIFDNSIYRKFLTILGTTDAVFSDYELFLNAQYLENEMYLIQIVNEIFNNNQASNWMSEWITSSKNVIAEHYSYSKTIDGSCYDKAIYIILKHLGLDRLNGMLIQYFLKRLRFHFDTKIF